MKTVTVTLGSRPFVVENLKFRAEREWRHKYDKPITELINAISMTRDLAGKEFEKPGDLVREIGAALLSYAADLVMALVKSPDLLFDAICEYAPNIQAERVWVEENCYQDEVAKAFVEVLQLAYPFGSLLSIVTSLGRMGEQTSPSSPSPSGESSKTS